MCNFFCTTVVKFTEGGAHNTQTESQAQAIEGGYKSIKKAIISVFIMPPTKFLYK